MKLKQSLLCLFLTLSLLLGCPPAALAAPEEISFSDVSPSAWYGENGQDIVGEICRSGLMRGVSDSQFAPQRQLTVAETVCIAVRAVLRSQGRPDTLPATSPWHQAYFTQAEELGLLPQGIGPAMADQPILRAQAAAVFDAVATALSLPTLRQVLSLPDVSGQTPYYQSILSLYDRGVLSGSDGAGSFYPYRTITRAEGAAIALRLLDPGRRQGLVLRPHQGADVSSHYTAGMRIDSLPQLYDMCYWAADHLLHELSFTLSPTLYQRLSQRDFPFDRGIESWKASYYPSRQLLQIQLELGLNAQVSALLRGTARPEDASAEARAWRQSISYLAAQLTQSAQSETQAAALLHDYMLASYRYDTRLFSGSMPDSSYSFPSLLQEGVGVCQAYAELYQLLLQARGIDCRLITGQAGGGGHAWNLALLDGARYHVDVTYDDPVPDQGSRIIRTYFGRSDAFMAADHQWDTALWPPCPQTLS